MGRSPSTFKVADVTRAFLAAKKAGVLAEIHIDLEQKRMTITPIKPSAAAEPVSESNLSPDDELERWRKKKNAG
jgi:hypothetical protein